MLQDRNEALRYGEGEDKLRSDHDDLGHLPNKKLKLIITGEGFVQLNMFSAAQEVHP